MTLQYYWLYVGIAFCITKGGQFKFKYSRFVVEFYSITGSLICEIYPNSSWIQFLFFGINFTKSLKVCLFIYALISEAMCIFEMIDFN